MSEYLTPDDTRDALRKIGGLLLGLGFLVWFFRKGDELSDFVRFLIFAAPAAFLYGLGVFTEKVTGGLRAWQAVYSVLGLVFVPPALFAFIDLIGGTPDAPLNTFWVFGVTSALALYAGVMVGIRFQLLAGSIALIVSWSALWDEILSDGITAHYGVYRGLLGILSIALLAGALYVWRANPGRDAPAATATDVGGDRGLWRASELFTGAGVAAVVACGMGVLSVFNIGLLGFAFNLPGTSTFWDTVLLLVSLGLVGVGSQIGVRGPVYVGSIGLLLFAGIVGAHLSDPDSAGSFGVWPLLLLILGALAVVLSGVKEASQGERPRQLVARLRGR